MNRLVAQRNIWSVWQHQNHGCLTSWVVSLRPDHQQGLTNSVNLCHSSSCLEIGSSMPFQETKLKRLCLSELSKLTAKFAQIWPFQLDLWVSIVIYSSWVTVQQSGQDIEEAIVHSLKFAFIIRPKSRVSLRSLSSLLPSWCISRAALPKVGTFFQ